MYLNIKTQKLEDLKIKNNFEYTSMLGWQDTQIAWLISRDRCLGRKIVEESWYNCGSGLKMEVLYK